MEEKWRLKVLTRNNLTSRVKGILVTFTTKLHEKGIQFWFVEICFLIL